MADLNDDSLKKLLGDDPITTSISVRIRQDEQTLNNLERRFRSIKQEAEGIAKALKEAGTAASSLGLGGGRPGTTGTRKVGDTPVAGGPVTPTPLDKGQGVIGTIQAARQMYSAAGGGRAGITAITQGMGGGMAIAGAGAAFATQAISAGIGMIDARVDRGRDYALSADRVTMLFQQMKGMSQQAIQDTYRQPLTQYKLGAGGINTLLGLEARTGLMASRQAAGVEALRVSSGFSVSSPQAASLLGQLASPEVVNRMFMTMGTSLMTPGGGQQNVLDLMQQIVSRTGLSNPAIARTAMAPGSVTRSNLNFMGVTGEFQDQVIQYAQQQAAYRQKGGKGMYNPQDPKHQKLMGIDSNFAMQAEETDRLRTKREEEFYSRQADNYADLEKQTQRLIQVFAALEDKLSGIIGFRTSNRITQNIAGGIGSFIGGALGSLIPIPGVGTAIGSSLGYMAGNMVGSAIGDDVPIMTKSQLNTLSSTTSTRTSTNYTSGYAVSPYGAMPTTNYKTTYTATTGATPTSSGLSAFAGRRIRAGGSTASEANVPKRLVARKKLEPLENRLSPAFVNEIRMAFTPVTFRGKPTTLAELVQKKEFLNAHPDLQKAFIQAALDAREEGKILGITSGFRSSQDQTALFLSRYQPVDYETGSFYQGRYWDKKDPSFADVAVPGAKWSNHEHGLAFDVEGDIDWLISHASKYGLENFANINNEPWHFQLAGLREQGSGGGLGYNERTGFTPPNIGYGANVDDQVIKNALSGVGLQSKTWERNVNGASKNIGIEFLNVFGNSSTKPGSPTPNSKLTGNANAVERFLSQSTKSAPGLYDTSKTSSTSFNQESAAKMLYDAGFRGQDLIKMLAIMGRESGYDPSATRFTDQEESYGLLQHNMHPTLTSASQNRTAWGLSANTDLFDPMTNIRIAYEKYQWYQAHGMDPFHGWGAYKGMDPMYGTGNYLQSSIDTATRLGYFSGTYVGDYVPPSAKTPGKGRSEDRYGPMASPMGLAMMSPQGARSSGAAVIQGGHTITVSPTINISSSGSGMDQDMEKMARKVAELLEREVNRTMNRRT